MSVWRQVLLFSSFILFVAGGPENGEEDSKKATEEELSFIKSSICEQWKKLAVSIRRNR